VMHARSSTESSCGKDASVVDASSMTAMIDVFMMIPRQQHKADRLCIEIIRRSGHVVAVDLCQAPRMNAQGR
jgi:hypothetical protein